MSVGLRGIMYEGRVYNGSNGGLGMLQRVGIRCLFSYEPSYFSSVYIATVLLPIYVPLSFSFSSVYCLLLFYFSSAITISRDYMRGIEIRGGIGGRGGMEEVVFGGTKKRWKKKGKNLIC